VLRGRLVQPPQDLSGPGAQKPAFFDRGIRSVRLELLDGEHLALKTRGSWGQTDLELSPQEILNRSDPKAPEKLPLYLGLFEFVHNVRNRGKALLGALIELLVTPAPRNAG